MNDNYVVFAEQLAAYAHKGQRDKAGRDYIEHPRAVAAMVSLPEEKAAAFLHDVLEDTFVAEETLRNLFGDRITDAVCALTHRPGETYADYVLRASQNSLARKVKIADLQHNMDLSRLPRITEEDLARADKYRRVREYLLSLDNT